MKWWREKSMSAKVLLIVEILLIIIFIFEVGFIGGCHWVKYYG